jgi:hypothetical protein
VRKRDEEKGDTERDVRLKDKGERSGDEEKENMKTQQEETMRNKIQKEDITKEYKG